MMRAFGGYIVTLVATVMLVASCSVVNEAIKSGDPQYAYQQAVMLYNDSKWEKPKSCRKP